MFPYWFNLKNSSSGGAKKLDIKWSLMSSSFVRQLPWLQFTSHNLHVRTWLYRFLYMRCIHSLEGILKAALLKKGCTIMQYKLIIHMNLYLTNYWYLFESYFLGAFVYLTQNYQYICSPEHLFYDLIYYMNIVIVKVAHSCECAFSMFRGHQ